MSGEVAADEGEEGFGVGDDGGGRGYLLGCGVLAVMGKGDGDGAEDNGEEEGW